jgi:predicted RNA binding protein YcfA (HicA-like mRNA interferase family)
VKAVSGKEMCRLLERKGWTLNRIKGSHHIYKRQGHKTIAVPVHGNKTLKPGLQSRIMKDAALTEDDL